LNLCQSHQGIILLHVALKNSLIDNQKGFQMHFNDQTFLDDDGNIFYSLKNAILMGHVKCFWKPLDIIYSWQSKVTKNLVANKK